MSSDREDTPNTFIPESMDLQGRIDAFKKFNRETVCRSMYIYTKVLYHDDGYIRRKEWIDTEHFIFKNEDYDEHGNVLSSEMFIHQKQDEDPVQKVIRRLKQDEDPVQKVIRRLKQASRVLLENPLTSRLFPLNVVFLFVFFYYLWYVYHQ